MAQQIYLDYFGIEIWLPIVVAVVSIVLSWLCVRFLNRYDEQNALEDEKLTETIKATRNPDKINTVEKSKAEEQDSTSENEELHDHGQMSQSERENERRIEQEQLQNIYKLMAEDENKYGVHSIRDVKEQLKRYKVE